MPNWCSNYLVVNGPAEELKRFRDEVAIKFTDKDGKEVESCLSFNNHVPIWDYTTGKALNQKITNNKEGTNMDLSHLYTSWGTKWDVVYGDADLQESKDAHEDLTELHYSYQTAWGPADEWFRVVITKFPELEFSMDFEEGGNAVYGEMTAANGEITDETSYTHEEWLMEKTEEYPEFVKEIKGFTQEQLIKYFSSVKDFQCCCIEDEEWPEALTEECDGWDSDMYDFASLAAYVIEQIEPVNLPHFVNVDWGYSEYNTMFKERLAKGE